MGCWRRSFFALEARVGLFWSFVVFASVCRRCPCAGRHLLSLSPKGTSFGARGKESRQRKPLKPPMPATIHLSPSLPVAPERLSPRTFQVSDKALIPPAARYARCGWVCRGNRMVRMSIGEDSHAPMVLLCPSGRAAPKAIAKKQGVLPRAHTNDQRERSASLADPSAARVASSGMNESFVTNFGGAR